MGSDSHVDVLECLVDMREYDVPYYVRVSIDAGVRVGCWYAVEMAANNVNITRLVSMVEKVRAAFPLRVLRVLQVTSRRLVSRPVRVGVCLCVSVACRLSPARSRLTLSAPRLR